MLCAAPEQAIRTNYVKHKIDKTAQSPLCRMCDKKSETISHIVSECEKLAQKEYKRRHDNVARIVHWKLCGKYNLKRSEKWYEHALQGAAENEEVRIQWDVMIQCDTKIKARKPDIVLMNKNEFIKVIPVVVGALGSTSKKLKKYIEEMGVVISTGLLQKTALLRDSSHIKAGFRLRIRFVETWLG